MKFQENRIKYLRLISGYLTRKDFAEAVGVTPAMITLYEQGKSRPKLDVLFKIASLCNVTPNDLYPHLVHPVGWKEEIAIKEQKANANKPQENPAGVVPPKEDELPDLEEEIKNF